MPITYYPNSVYVQRMTPTDKAQKKRRILSVESSIDLTAAGLSTTLWYPYENWIVHDVLMHFSGATARNYSLSKVIGRGIITNLNDLLWVKCDGYSSKPIVLTQGFYDGTTLAAQIKAKLDIAFTGIATVAPFTVTWSAVTGKFTITSAGGNIQFFNTNTCQNTNKNSTAGIVIGFTTDSARAASITGDTAVFGLGDIIPINAESPSTDINTVINVDTLSPNFDLDTGLNLTVSTVALNMDYKVTYEELF